MEVYFSGTIERIIFENVSNFYRILLLDIEDTNAEDFDDFEIIVTGTMADVIYYQWQFPKIRNKLWLQR